MDRYEELARKSTSSRAKRSGEPRQREHNSSTTATSISNEATWNDNGKRNESHTLFEENTTELRSKSSKPRKWLQDRCDGKESVMDPQSRPCCPIFYTPLLLKFFPDIMETNCVMEFLGKIGCVNPDNIKMRRFIMITALIGTIVGWAFLIVADFAVSDSNYDFIDVAAFSIGSLRLKTCRPDETCPEASQLSFVSAATRYSLGLRAAAYTRYNVTEYAETQRIVTTFDSFCEGDQGFTLVRPEDCNKCADASQAMVVSILMASITYFFTFTTDVLRIWPNYDVNCQKVFGGFFAIISAVLGVRTWYLFRYQCVTSFRAGWFCFDENLNTIDCDDTSDAFFGSAYFHWQAGTGLVCLGIATFAKILDLVCNIILPTPPITRDCEEQWEYERIATEQEENKRIEESENGEAE